MNARVGGGRSRGVRCGSQMARPCARECKNATRVHTGEYASCPWPICLPHGGHPYARECAAGGLPWLFPGYGTSPGPIIDARAGGGRGANNSGAWVCGDSGPRQALHGERRAAVRRL